MKKLHAVVLYLSLFLQLAALIIYLRGFFPIKQGVPGYANLHDAPPEPSPDNLQQLLDGVARGQLPAIQGPSATYGKLVIVMIDALRADFVFGDARSWMPYTKKMLENGRSLNFIARAHPPTVTMPRIKAFTTGGIPGFVDVVLNFDSSELEEDNLISQLHRAARNIVFYGDDTWIKLFPDQFLRSDGTTSFFVSDYTEVDANVTRHIDDELKNKDWDVMILHYLGLDHIGHLTSPDSPLVEPKLKEMDAVIEKLNLALTKLDKESELPSLFILCGDHGMSKLGSHGGASYDEIVTPLVMMSSAIKGRDKFNFTSIEGVYQIDAVPMLSLLLGLPIPQNSLGVVPLQALYRLPIKQKLHGLELNVYQLAKVFRQNVPGYQSDESYMMYKRALGGHAEWLKQHSDDQKMKMDPEHLGDKVASLYLRAMFGMREKLSRGLSKYDMQALITGILLLWVVLFALLHCHINMTILTLNVTPVSIGIFIFLTVTVPNAHFFTCTSPYRSDVLCHLSLLSLLTMVHLYAAAVVLVAFLVFTITKKTLTQFLKAIGSRTVFELFLLFGTIVHTLTLLSSSFVEEEHQTWYFFVQTANMAIFAKVLGNALGNYFDYHGPDESYKNMDAHVLVGRAESTEGSHLERRKMGPPEVQQESFDVGQTFETRDKIRFQNEAVDHWKLVAFSVIVLCLCRILRSCNQTGDKWIHLPDIGDWLLRPEHKSILSFTVFAALVVVVIIIWLTLTDPIYRVVLTAAAVGVYFYRAATGAVSIPGFYKYSTSGVPEAQTIYTLLGILIVYSFLQYLYTKWMVQGEQPSIGTYFRVFSGKLPRHLHAILIILVLLLIRPHNIIEFAMIVIVEYMISIHLIKHMDLSVSSLTLLYVWFGQAGFFYQGNSNSLATVDVSAGYVGLDSYSPVIIGLLMAASTYASPIFWFCSLVSVIGQRFINEGDGENRYNTAVYEVSFTLCLSRALPLAVYTILTTHLRYHIFVWTVFSPKLLYEGTYMLITIVFIILL